MLMIVKSHYIILLPYGVTLHRYGNFKVVLRKSLVELVLMLPTLYLSFLTSYTNHISAYTALFYSYVLANILLVSVYEIQYVVNDVIIIKKEDRPSIRIYPVKPEILIIFRIFYFIITTVLMVLFHFDMLNITVAIMLISLAFLLHNFQSYKLKRTYTFALVRLTRYVFIPLCLINNLKLLSNIVIAFIPLLFIEIIQAHEYNLEKYGVTIPRINYPWFYLYGIFLPIQLILTDWMYVSGNILLVTLSLLKHALNYLSQKIGKM